MGETEFKGGSIPMKKNMTIRPRVIGSAAFGFALALVVGYPVGGWLAGTNDGIRPQDGNMTSFHLAKAGVDRGMWKINRSRVNLDALMDGAFVPGLNGDKTYRDVPGGTYKVQARYDKAAKRFLVKGTGKDAQTGEERAIELVLKQQPGRDGTMQVEWQEVEVAVARLRGIKSKEEPSVNQRTQQDEAGQEGSAAGEVVDVPAEKSEEKGANEGVSDRT